MFKETVTNIMRTVASSLQYPVVVILLIILAVSIFLLGTLVVEAITERRKLKVNLPKLVDQLRGNELTTVECIRDGGLLKSQVAILLELTQHPDLTDDMRESLGIRMTEEESGRFERRVILSDVLAKLGPTFGLLGTLIPLGPGIIALGEGNTYVLSQSLMVAFDTTILGLISAAICMVISTIRKHWYKNYMSVLETLTECVLEVERNDEVSPSKI